MLKYCETTKFMQFVAPMRTVLFVSIILVLSCQEKKMPPSKEITTIDKIVIAHRGASGYLPEHTLPAKAMAYAMSPDYIEQDIVLSKDGVPVVLHDIYLDEVSDVAEKFPERKRNDGRYYVIDFDFEELKLLQLVERFDRSSGEQKYPKRFPKGLSNFQIHSLYEEIELIQGLNESTGLSIGIYPEIKNPTFHRNEGQDISKIVLEVLKVYGYLDKKDHCLLQCFDAQELKRIRTELKSSLYLVQLIESKEEENELDFYTSFADGIGVWYKAVSPEFVLSAQKEGLKVHGYTFRADDLGDFTDFESLLGHGLDTLNFDGIFTDHPDKAVAYLKKK